MRKSIMSSVVSVLCLLAVMTVVAYAQAPQTINYQGVLLDSVGLAVDGEVEMTFAIYDQADGVVAPLWSETRMVNVEHGKYSVILGKTTPITLPAAKPYWLGITVGTDDEMIPRVEMTSVMYSLFPEGLQGPAGPAGPKGDQGEQGPQGPAEDATNELNTSISFNAATGVLTITDAGGAKTVDLSRLTNADPPCFDTGNRYVDCANGTVTDTVTGLIWLKNAYCFGGLNWPNAGNAATGLQHGECGLTDNSLPGDWRLPTKAEWEATTARAVALGCIHKGANDPPTLTDTRGRIRLEVFAFGACESTLLRMNVRDDTQTTSVRQKYAS